MTWAHCFHLTWVEQDPVTFYSAYLWPPCLRRYAFNTREAPPKIPIFVLLRHDFLLFWGRRNRKLFIQPVFLGSSKPQTFCIKIIRFVFDLFDGIWENLNPQNLKFLWRSKFSVFSFSASFFRCAYTYCSVRQCKVLFLRGRKTSREPVIMQIQGLRKIAS